MTEQERKSFLKMQARILMLEVVVGLLADKLAKKAGEEGINGDNKKMR